MSKYADIEQIKEVIRSEWVKYIPMDLDINLSFVLGKISEVPTIEVEDAISRASVVSTGYNLKPVEDAISKAYLEQEIEKQIKTAEKDKPFYWQVWNNALDKVVELIENAPSVIPKPKEGEWIKRSSVGNWECSLCGSDVIASEQKLANYNWCPNCRAKMKGADDYERATEQMEHDALYEPTYNSEDGSM